MIRMPLRVAETFGPVLHHALSDRLFVVQPYALKPNQLQRVTTRPAQALAAAKLPTAGFETFL